MSSYNIRILHLGLSPNRGGIESVVYSWWKHIDKEKVHFDFVNVYHEPIAFEEEFKNAESQIYYIPARKENPGKHSEELKKIIEKGNYDFVHCHVMSLSEPEPVKICNALELKTQVIIHSHTAAKLNNMSLKRKVLHKYGSIRLKKYYYLRIACGYKAGREMFHTTDFTVIENGIDIDRYRYSEEKRSRFRERYNIPKDAIVIGHVGRNDAVKNYPFLIETFSYVRKENKNAMLLLIGDVDQDDEIKSLLIRFHIEGSTVLTGKINSTEECYSAMDIFFFPSVYEGISVSMIEAQASGLECVVSENIAHESAVSDYVHFQPINNPQLMAEKVKEYLPPYSVARDKRIIDSNYDINNTAEKLIQYYVDKKEVRIEEWFQMRKN